MGGERKLCEHGKRKARCRYCGGSAFCEHGKFKRECRYCGGRAFCEHGKRKATCRDCGGSAFCEHGKFKATCRDCGGSAVCEHGKFKAQCRDCVSATDMLGGNIFCRICLSTTLSSARKRSGIHMCAGCDVTVPDRIEHVVRPMLLQLVHHPPSATDDTLFGQTCDVVKRRRPDLLWLHTDRCVLTEVDENGGHGSLNYTASCDFGWAMDMVASLVELYRDHGWNGGKVPRITILRWNPDEYDGGRVALDNRIETLAARINALLTCDVSPGEDFPLPQIEYYYYHSKCEAHIEFAASHPDAARVIRHRAASSSACDDVAP